MNPEAFMLLDRLEKLMCSPQSQHPSDPFLGPVASMSRGWKGILWKFGGEVGEGRVHLEDTFSVPLDSSSLEGRPLQPLWPDPLSKRVPSVCAPLGPSASAFFVDFPALCPQRGLRRGIAPIVTVVDPVQCPPLIPSTVSNRPARLPDSRLRWS